MQKRKMDFTPGLENEDSFMIIPNEFVKDHELTQDEIHALMTPDPDYEKAKSANYWRIWNPRFLSIAWIKLHVRQLIKKFLGNDHERILNIKLRMNKLLRRRLPSKW